MAATNTRGITRDEFLAAAGRMVDCQLDLMVGDARHKKRVKRLTDELAESQKPTVEMLEANRGVALLYLMAHKGEYVALSRKTEEVGSVYFGFRLVSNVEIDDEEEVIAWARENGYTDVIVEPEPLPEPRATVSKSALAKRLRAKEEVPGARLLADYEPFVEPIKALKAEARKGNGPGRP